MKGIIVGSEALKWHGITNREPNDIDIWSEHQLPLAAADVSIMPKEIMTLVESCDGYATVNSLYTIKLSHLGWDIFFEKHKRDALLLKANGAKLLPELYKALVAHWRVEHGNKDFLSLYQVKSEFFNDHVEYTYDHDYLHELVAYPNKPVYTQCLKDGEQVAIDKPKFDKMTFEDQIKMFREEIVVIAAERWLLNTRNKGKVSWLQAYQYSVRKTITQLTKNWATDFLVLNLDYFIKPNYNEFKNLIETLGVNNMSKVDLSIFDKMAADDRISFNYEGSSGMILCLADGDISVEDGLDFPEKGERAYRDPTYQSEVAAYREKSSAIRHSVLGEYGYEHLEQDGGGEGGSEYCYGVFSFEGKIYRASWQYYSHHGYDYDSIEDTLCEVQAKTKTITVYE